MTDASRARLAVPVGRSGPGVAVAPFEVRGADTLRADQQSILELVGAGLCRALGEELATRLRLPVALTMRPAEQRTWRSLLADLPEPYSAAVTRWAPLAGVGLTSVEIPLAVGIVDRLLGGRGAPAPHPLPVTEVEGELLGELYRRAARRFAAALATVAELTPDVGPHESRLGLIKASPPGAELLVVDLDMTVGPAAGRLRLAVPAPELMARLDDFAGTSPGPVRTLRDGGPLLDAPVEVAVRFDPVALAPDDLCELAVGDIIALPHPTGRPLHLCAGGRPYLDVVPGRRRGSVAVAVVAPDPGAAL